MTKSRVRHGGHRREVYVPAVGASVEIRPIPPKLQRAISAKAIRDGRTDLNELMVLKLVYGVVQPNFTEDEARELSRRLTLGTLEPIVDMIDRLSGTDEHVRAAGAMPRSSRKTIRPAVLATACMRRGHTLPALTPRPRERRSHPARRQGSRRVAKSRGDSDQPPDDEADHHLLSARAAP